MLLFKVMRNVEGASDSRCVDEVLAENYASAVAMYSSMFGRECEFYPVDDIHRDMTYGSWFMHRDDKISLWYNRFYVENVSMYGCEYPLGWRVDIPGLTPLSRLITEMNTPFVASPKSTNPPASPFWFAPNGDIMFSTEEDLFLWDMTR